MDGHILDAYHLGAGVDNFQTWADEVSLSEFEEISEKVFRNFFSSPAVASQREKPMSEQDFLCKNTLLYNRDALIYLEFCNVIKQGDIGRVLNVLRIWLVKSVRSWGSCI